MKPEDRVKVENLRQVTGYRLGLQEWEHVSKLMLSETLIMVKIDTYEVQVLVREDRYHKKGTRVIVLEFNGTRWEVADDVTTWDDDFTPYIYEKIGRRKTADEMVAQREWEKMCYRPGNSRNPLDSYDRVGDPFIRSTDKMERHF